MSYEVLLIAPHGWPFHINGEPVAAEEIPSFLARLGIPHGWFVVVVPSDARR
jgi:hypothetical protein